MSSHAGVRAFRLLLAVMTVWCLGCVAFDRIVEDAAGQTPIAIRQGTSVAAACATVPGVEALHACQGVNGHASECWTTSEAERAAADLPASRRDVIALPSAPRDPALRPLLA